MSDEKANAEAEKRAATSGREGVPAESAPQTMKSAGGPPSSAMVLSGSEIEVVTDPSPQLGAPKPLTPPKPPPPAAPAAVKPAPIEEVEPESVEKRPSFFDVFNVERYEQVEAEVKAQEEKLKAAGMGKGGKGAAKPAPAPRQRQQSRPDDDLFNLSGGLFGTQPLAPLVAPDLSALSPGLSKELGAPPARPSQTAAQPAAQPPAQAAPAAAAPRAAPVVTNTAAAPSSLLGTTTKAADASDLEFPKPAGSRKKLFIGIAAAGILAVAAFLLARGGSSEDPVAPETASTETAPSGAGNAPANDAPQGAAPPAAPAADQGGSGAKAAGDKDKRAAGDAKGGGDRPADRDKAKTSDKAPEKDPGGKAAAADPKALASGGDKSQSLAAAMAAGTGNTAAAPDPGAGGGADFNASAARSALNTAAGAAAGCKKPDDPSGVAKVSVTFAPSGRATKAQVNGPPFAGTSTGGCIAAAFRSASVPPFSGSPVTVSKSVTIR